MTTGSDHQSAERGVLPPALVMLAPAGAASAADLAGLTAAEQDRAAAFRRPADRDSYVAAHLLARQCAARLAGMGDPAAVTLVQRCRTCGGRDHGRPAVRDRADLHVSLSHSPGLVAAAAGWAPVGVDVELTRGRTFDDGLLGHALAPAEQAQVRAASDPGAAFLRHWMRKEALIKVGLTTLGTMAEVDLSGLPPLAVPPAGAPAARQTRFGRWHVLDWAGEAGPGLADAGLAAVGAQPLELVIAA
jgi:4'-phosphopantetheinyl transferase